MSENQDLHLKARHSFYSTQTINNAIEIENYCKSDANFTIPKSVNNITRRQNSSHKCDGAVGEYYKKYEHDEVPVKDSNDFRGDTISLTNSQLEKLEFKLFDNVSQDNSSSISSLESNIKFFRTTVQEIFDNFYASMQDFELYKKRFHEILEKNREDALADMEDFIKDMIHHIMSSESCLSYGSRQSNEPTYLEVHDKQTHVSSVTDQSSIGRNTSAETYSTGEHLDSLRETYKNDNYLTDSTLDDNASKAKRTAMKEDIFNIFLLGGSPCVQIKMNERNLLSEINIKEPCASQTVSNYVASAEDLKRLAAKKMEMEKYAREQLNHNLPDREIPVKLSNAKKNIHVTNEDNDNLHERETEKSLMARICSFLCKKIRKTPFS